MSYRERREARINRLREWAEKREAHASATFEADKVYTEDHAFNTQPGHIPERARLIARHDREYASLQKAEQMREKADNIEKAASHAIYSDDSDAIEKLRQRINALEAERERVKAYNASCRQNKPNLSLLTEEEKRALLQCIRFQFDAYPKGQFPSYHLANLNGNLNRQKAKLTQLERMVSP